MGVVLRGSICMRTMGIYSHPYTVVRAYTSMSMLELFIDHVNKQGSNISSVSVVVCLLSAILGLCTSMNLNRDGKQLWMNYCTVLFSIATASPLLNNVAWLEVCVSAGVRGATLQ
jgi:hypothetical protein